MVGSTWLCGFIQSLEKNGLLKSLIRACLLKVRAKRGCLTGCSQALIQYQSRQSAVQARNALQGRNIYSGCCQLDIRFSNFSELQVNYNNENYNNERSRCICHMLQGLSKAESPGRICEPCSHFRLWS